ncbi:unannotated protein [freshwater metagenome]|uniref:Unannotated protein n=1 Tax=freshwater metagenome TaxID=449393 RepID=A0A6J7JD35_9ZZZZ
MNGGQSIPGSRKHPVRTCIGCREREESPGLLRVALEGDRIVPDIHRRIPGRGAWIHVRAACEQAATRKRAWGRALRQQGSPDASAVQEFLSARV